MLHVHAPKPTATWRAVMRCHHRKVRRRFVVKLYAWYGPQFTCCACGNVWSDGEWLRYNEKMRVSAAKEARKAWLTLTCFADIAEALHAAVIG